MLGHMIELLKPKSADVRANDPSLLRPRHEALCSETSEGIRERTLGSIRELHSLSRRGLWGILLFLCLSAITLYLSEAGHLALVPGDLRELFGDPPPMHLLHIVLGVSWLSALVLILGRVSGDGKPCYSWYNIGLPTAFYPLYVFSDPTGGHFPAVFAGGLVLLLVEHLSVLSYASKAIREETERLNHLPTDSLSHR